MPFTMAQKIFSRKAGRPVAPGELIVCDVDLVVSHDGNRPQPLEVFADMGGESVFDSNRVKLFIDHAANVPNSTIAEIHKLMRAFAARQGLELFGSGEGICHQVVAEQRAAAPGDLVVGSDSHTCTQGALNLFATGVGSSDTAVAMLTGQLWFKVPESIHVYVVGNLPQGTFAKDIALEVVSRLGAREANWAALEFTGPGISQLSIGDRLTICNMSIEAGAKTGIMEGDSLLSGWFAGLKRPWSLVKPDPDAPYRDRLDLNLNSLSPRVAVPHAVDDVHPIKDLEGTRIDQAVIGTCTNGRLGDLETAARILGGRRVHPRVRMFITPASRTVFLDALRRGIISALVEAGAVILPPSCSGCTGGGFCGTPSDGERVITTANRNFQGRLGNPRASLYLASPATVAASALAGHIADPRHYIEP